MFTQRIIFQQRKHGDRHHGLSLDDSRVAVSGSSKTRTGTHAVTAARGRNTAAPRGEAHGDREAKEEQERTEIVQVG